MREQNLLEAAQYAHAIADAPGIPVRLCGARVGYRRTHFGRASAVEFAQNFARRRVYGGNADTAYSTSVAICEEVYAGRRARQRAASVLHFDQIHPLAGRWGRRDRARASRMPRKSSRLTVPSRSAEMCQPGSAHVMKKSAAAHRIDQFFAFARPVGGEDLRTLLV